MNMHRLPTQAGAGSLSHSQAPPTLSATRLSCPAEGLHLIDFEQLKIENQSLNEKIEERNEELLKLRKKTTMTVQVGEWVQSAAGNRVAGSLHMPL